MRISHHFLRIPRIHAVSQRPHHGPLQGPNHPRLAGTPETQRHPVFPRICKFYRCFIFGYSEITVPLTHLTRRGTPWHFTDECRSAFKALKKAFTTAPVLTHWIPDTQITVETDASNYTCRCPFNYNIKW